MAVFVYLYLYTSVFEVLCACVGDMRPLTSQMSATVWSATLASRSCDWSVIGHVIFTPCLKGDMI